MRILSSNQERIYRPPMTMLPQLSGRGHLGSIFTEWIKHCTMLVQKEIMRNHLTPLVFIVLGIHNMPVSAQGQYPLGVGNVWEYWDNTDNEYLYTVTAIGDTILESGYVYAVLESEWASGGGTIGYVRYSGPRVYYYTPEEGEEDLIAFDFSKTVGDTVAIHYHPGDTSVVTVVYDQLSFVFGELRRQWGFLEESQSSSNYILTEVTDSIGITWVSWEAAPYDIYLIGAIIEGTTYGMLQTEPASTTLYPHKYELFQNYPNPFNGSTTISFQIPLDEYAQVVVFDVLGRQVRRLLDVKLKQGFYHVEWDGKDDSGLEVSSGIYLCHFQTRKLILSRKLTVIR